MSERIGRRQFIGSMIAGGIAGKLAAVAGCSKEPEVRAMPAPPTTAPATAPAKRSLTDMVPLGKSGVKVSRLGMGTGMRGWNHQSNQTRLGMEALTRLFRHAFDRGIRYLDCADQYGSHEYVRNALKYIPREKLTILSKTVSRNPEGVRKDLERFRSELGTDYIDIVLLHCMTDHNWADKLAGPMDVLSEAKSKGLIKAHGVSCHTLPAIALAAETKWVEVDLARINPRGAKMDGKPEEVVPILKRLHARGAGVIGMKILGEGTFKDDVTINESLRFALSQDCVDAFIIGFESAAEINDIFRRCDSILVG
jgi:aryl-alcohol dehydrogenase-like predicted oxidoreductase